LLTTVFAISVIACSVWIPVIVGAPLVIALVHVR